MASGGERDRATVVAAYIPPRAVRQQEVSRRQWLLLLWQAAAGRCHRRPLAADRVLTGGSLSPSDGHCDCATQLRWALQRANIVKLLCIFLICLAAGPAWSTAHAEPGMEAMRITMRKHALQFVAETCIYVNNLVCMPHMFGRLLSPRDGHPAQWASPRAARDSG